MAYTVKEQLNIPRRGAPLAALAAAGKFDLTPAERKQLAALDALAKKYTDPLAGAGHNAHKEDRDARQKAFEANPTEANLSRLRDADLNPGALKAQYAALRDSLKTAAKKFHFEKIGPFVAPLMRRAADGFDLVANEIAAQEKMVAENFNVSFQESLTVSTIRQRANELRSSAGQACAYGSIGNAGSWLKDLI